MLLWATCATTGRSAPSASTGNPWSTPSFSRGSLRSGRHRRRGRAGCTPRRGAGHRPESTPAKAGAGATEGASVRRSCLTSGLASPYDTRVAPARAASTGRAPAIPTGYFSLAVCGEAPDVCGIGRSLSRGPRLARPGRKRGPACPERSRRERTRATSPPILGRPGLTAPLSLPWVPRRYEGGGPRPVPPGGGKGHVIEIRASRTSCGSRWGRLASLTRGVSITWMP